MCSPEHACGNDGWFEAFLEDGLIDILHRGLLRSNICETVHEMVAHSLAYEAHQGWQPSGSPQGPTGNLLDLGERTVERLAHALQTHEELVHEHVMYRVVQEEDRRREPLGKAEGELSRGPIVIGRGRHQLGEAAALSLTEKVMWPTV